MQQRVSTRSKIPSEILEQGRYFLGDACNGGALWAAFELGPELVQLGSAADGVSFDAAVRQILGIAADAEALRRAHGEIAVTDSLHHSTDEKTSGLASLRRVWHGRCGSVIRKRVILTEARGAGFAIFALVA